MTAAEQTPGGADPLDYADIRHFVLSVESHIESKRKQPQTYKVVLPIPKWLQSPWTFPAARGFARSLRRDDGDAWLVANESDADGFHFRGMIITPRPAAHVAELWASRTGAEGVRIDPISALSSHPLEVMLARTILWSCERAGPAPLWTDERVVVAGAFRDLWRYVAERP